MKLQMAVRPHCKPPTFLQSISNAPQGSTNKTNSSTDIAAVAGQVEIDPDSVKKDDIGAAVAVEVGIGSNSVKSVDGVGIGSDSVKKVDTAAVAGGIGIGSGGVSSRGVCLFVLVYCWWYVVSNKDSRKIHSINFP